MIQSFKLMCVIVYPKLSVVELGKMHQLVTMQGPEIGQKIGDKLETASLCFAFSGLLGFTSLFCTLLVYKVS